MIIRECSVELLVSVDEEHVRGLELEVQRGEAELTSDSLRHRVAERDITELDIVTLGDTYIREVVVAISVREIGIILTSVVSGYDRDIRTLFIPRAEPTAIEFLTEDGVVIVLRRELFRQTLDSTEGVDKVDTEAQVLVAEGVTYATEVGRSIRTGVEEVADTLLIGSSPRDLATSLG